MLDKDHDNVTESQIPFKKEDCTQEKGYQWNNENLYVKN